MTLAILFSLPFWAVGLGMVYGILMALFGQVRLLLTPQGIEQRAELFGFRWKIVPTSPLTEIDRLELRASYFTKNSDGDRVTVPASLIVWAGTRKYALNTPKHNGVGNTLTQSELEWLASELSDWLNLPIERTNHVD